MTNKDAIKFLQQLYPYGGHCWLDEQRMEAIGMAVKALQEEPTGNPLGSTHAEFMTAVESLGISQEEHDRIVDECIYGKEPELVDVDDLPKEEPVCDELEKVAIKYAQDKYMPVQTSQAFKAGAKWQEEKDDEEKVLTYKHGFEDCKKQMMAKAIDGIARPDDNEVWCDLKSFNFEDGDKIKVIVIKED